MEMNAKSDDYKIVIVGDGAVGKTWFVEIIWKRLQRLFYSLSACWKHT